MNKRAATAASAVMLSGTLSLGAFTPAFADSGHTAKSDIQSGNAYCGAETPLPVIGFTNYNRVGNVVHVEYHLKNGIPDSTYYVQLWGDGCDFFGSVATVTTNDNGVANGNGDVTVPPTSTRFFATAFGPNGANDTPAVILTP